MTTLCRSRSRYGRCGRPTKHKGPHGVPIGDGLWYGYTPGGHPLGYGHFVRDVFARLEAAARGGEDGTP